jgi:hypothetical protein
MPHVQICKDNPFKSGEPLHIYNIIPPLPPMDPSNQYVADEKKDAQQPQIALTNPMRTTEGLA